MTIYNHGWHVAGTWSNEGHTVTFTAVEDDSIIISELISLEEGIKEQGQLIKWQYRKIS